MINERLKVLDVLRGLAVVFMVLVHVLNVYGDFTAPGDTLRVIIDFFGGPPAAPVFMMVMGFLFAGQKNVDLKKGVIRGIRLLVTGYLLNLFRGALPVFIGRQILGLPAEHFSILYSYEYLILNVDILIFAGLSYICMTLIRRYLRKIWMWETVAVAVALFSPFLWGLGEAVPILGRIIEPLWGNDHDLVTFPLFPWLFFPLQGMVLYRLRLAFSDRFNLLLLFGGAAAVIVGLIPLIINFNFHFNDYGQMKPAGLFAITGFVLLWSLLTGLADRFWPLRLKTGVLAFLGKNVSTFYIIHWILIGWMMLFVPSGSLPLGMVFLAAVSGLLTDLYLKFMRGHRV